jgi:hypothetical protein
MPVQVPYPYALMLQAMFVLWCLALLEWCLRKLGAEGGCWLMLHPVGDAGSIS